MNYKTNENKGKNQKKSTSVLVTSCSSIDQTWMKNPLFK